ncbi:MAG: PEP-CTERM sorting domain-containing protein [Planctomycetota bacterium]
MYCKTMLAAAAALTTVSGGSIQAAPVPIINASFDDFNVDIQTSVTSTNLPGWTETDNGLELRIWDNDNTSSAQSQLNVDGLNQQWIGITTGATSQTPLTLTQTLGVTVQADTMYTLTAAFSTFVRSATVSTDSTQAQLIADLGGANETVLADTGVQSGAALLQNVFSDFQGVGDSTGANAVLVGESLSIVISLLQNDANLKVAADNIRLDATLVPEPGSLALLGLGGLCLLHRRRF